MPPEWVPGYVQVLQHLPGKTPSTWTRPARLRAGTELLIDTPTERLFLTARGMLVLACKREDGTVEKTQVSIV